MKCFTRLLIQTLFILIILTITPAGAEDFSGTWTGLYLYDHEYAYGPSGTLNVTMIQTGNEIRGTFETSSGSTGSFSGQAEGSTLTLHFTSPVDGQRVSGNFKAELLEGIIVWEGIGASSEGTQSISGALTKNWITSAGRWMSLSKDQFPSGYQTGDLWASISPPNGQTLTSAVLVTPLLETIPAAWDEEEQRFEFNAEMGIAHVETLYPNGIYTFVIELGNGTKGACFAVLAGKFPSQYPDITAPLPDQLVDEFSPLSISWEPWELPGPYTDIPVYFDVGYFYVTANTETGHVIPGSTLPENRWDRFSVGFSRPSGYAANKRTEAYSYVRTAPHTVDEYWIGKVNVHLPSGQVGGGIVIGMDGFGISSATLIPPAVATGLPLNLVQDEKYMETWRSGVRFAALADLESAYPDGNYTLRIVYQDATQEDFIISLTGNYPTQVPEIQEPAHLSNLYWWQGIDMQWTTWNDFDASDNFINCNIDLMASAAESDYLTSVEVWSDTKGMRANGGTIAPGVLNTGSTYAITPMFIKTIQDGVFKATARAIFVNSPVIPDSQLGITLSGNGTGMVAGIDGKINGSNTGGTLTAAYNRHQQVVLVAHPDPGSVFTGWIGDSDCMDGVVTMSANMDCTACFRKVSNSPVLFLLLSE